MRINQSAIFITGTDTDVGKTVVAAALVKGFAQKDQTVAYWKPVQAGLETKDADFIKRVTNLAPLPSALEIDLAASPDQGLRLENKPGLTALELANAKPETPGHLVIEGAGGLLVPINQQLETWPDVLKHWRIPVYVVARTGLGTLNHTALTVSALKDRGADVAGIIMSGTRHTDNEKSLQRMLPGLPLHWFPEQNDCAAPSSDDCTALADFVIQQTIKDSETISQKDRDSVWHPYTQHKLQSDPLQLTGAYGPWVYTSTGEKLIDASSSWWVNTIGHGREEIRAAISRQQAKMDHVIFANATHTPGVELANRLCKLTEKKLTRTFYSDNGSTAVEVGLKIAYQACQLRGEKSRTKFLALDGAYHGDTIGTMAVGGTPGFHKTFAELMYPVTHIAPVTSHPSSVCPQGSARRDDALAELEQHLKDHADSYAGIILEPLVQGAGGMLMQDESWLQQTIALCRQHGLYIILDEVFTGMGRVGYPFAFQRSQIEPDIVCLAKGLTGGTMPLSATLTTESLFNHFYTDSKSDAFLHGHSYTGNPIACAAALATLDIFTNEALPDRALNMQQTFLHWLEENSNSLGVKNGRACGAIMAMELAGSHGDYFDPRALKIPEVARRHGLFLRPLGNTVYLVLPLTISETDLDQTLSGLHATLRDLT